MDAATREGTSARPSASQLEAFGAELDALRQHVIAELGERDARYIRRVLRLQRSAEIAGRASLLVAVLPPAWFAGVGLLSLSKILENMEIGHNVLHGQYDWMNDPALASKQYEWDWACPAEHWRHSHNYMHHTFTNIVGMDRDVGYGLLRMADEQRWLPAHALQPVYALVQMLAFEGAVAVHDLEVNRLLTRDKPLRDAWPQVRAIAKKAAPQLLKDYVMFPLLAGPSAPFVITANLSANLVRNVWAFLVIFCGHFPQGVEMYVPADVEGETRGGWYWRQVRGSANIEGPRWLYLLSGHLSHQIEHHLFPDLPAHRYEELAPRVRAICERHGVSYNSGPLGRQVGSALRRVLRCALPSWRSARRASRDGARAPTAADPGRMPRTGARRHHVRRGACAQA